MTAMPPSFAGEPPRRTVVGRARATCARLLSPARAAGRGIRFVLRSAAKGWTRLRDRGAPPFSVEWIADYFEDLERLVTVMIFEAQKVQPDLARSHRHVEPSAERLANGGLILEFDESGLLTLITPLGRLALSETPVEPEHRAAVFERFKHGFGLGEMDREVFERAGLAHRAGQYFRVRYSERSSEFDTPVLFAADAAHLSAVELADLWNVVRPDGRQAFSSPSL